MLTSYEITNFRAFRHLRVERLGRVNLIVGRNGVGKTTLLESLRFYGMGSPLAIREYLGDQQEWLPSSSAGEPLLDLQALFHGRSGTIGSIVLGPTGDEPEQLRVSLIDVERVEVSGGYEYSWIEDAIGTGTGEGEIVKGLVLERRTRRIHISPEPSRRALTRGRYVGPAFVSARGVPDDDLTMWWDEISLTDSEERVLQVLSSMLPLDGITATSDPAGGDARARMFKARPRGQRLPVPLRSLGGGLIRLFQISVALEYSHLVSLDREPSLLDEQGEKPWPQHNRFLLVDEIENGIHYSVHRDLWRAVFRLARQNDVQVFATTHSWDCVEAFQATAAEDVASEGLLVRIESAGKKSRAVCFSEDELAIVTRENIEVR